jgi:hypothetical protein
MPQLFCGMPLSSFYLNDFDFTVGDDVTVKFYVADPFFKLCENFVDVDQKQFRNPDFRQVVIDEDFPDFVEVGLTRNFAWFLKNKNVLKFDKRLRLWNE